MDYYNCESCGCIANYNSKLHLCKSCDTIIFGEVKKYIEEHGVATVEEILKAVNINLQNQEGNKRRITPKMINGYLADSRLQEVTNVNKNTNVKKCLMCNALISDGYYCKRCDSLVKLKNALQQDKITNSNDDKSIGYHYISRK